MPFTATTLALTIAALGLQPATPPGTPKPAPDPLPAVAPDILPSLDSVLTKLETADKDLTSLTAAIRLIKRFSAITGGGMEVRYGILKFTSEPDKNPRAAANGGKPKRRFAVEIDTLIIDGRARDDKKSFIFDGRDLLEIMPQQKTYVLRHIVGPDQQKDPLRIGEGPFPIPVGQRKDDLITRFALNVVPPLDSAPDSPNLRRILFNCVQLKLVPKDGTDQAKAFTEIRLWYRASDMLPLFALTQNTDGSSNEVFLDDIVKNPPIPDSAFNTTPPKKTEGWTGEEQDLRDKATMGPGDPTSAPAAQPAPAPAANPSEPAPTQPK